MAKTSKRAGRTAASAWRLSRGQFFTALSLLLLLLSNFFLVSRLGGLASGAGSSGGYVPAAQGRDYAFWLAMGGLVLAVFLVALVIAFNYQGGGGRDWIEESLI